MLKRFVLVFGATLVLSAATGCGHPHAHHRVHHGAPGQPEGIRVSGQAEVRGAPDVARATLGVEVRAATAEEATTRLGAQMQSVLQALKAQGVAAADLQTAQLNVYFEQTRPMPPQPLTRGPEGTTEMAPEPKVPEGFYRATNTVEVTIRDIDRATQILSAATEAGANAVHGIRFELENDDALVAQARALAMKDAQQNAQQLAKLAGVELGEVVSISENVARPGPYMAPMMMKAESADAMQVEKGELTVSHQVELIYELADEGD